MRYRNDVIRSVLLHVRANLSKMLARDYSSCHATRSTLVILVANNVHKLRWPAKSLDINLIDHVLDLLKRKVRAKPLQLTRSQGAHACYSSGVCGHSTTVYSQTHFINEHTVPCPRDQISMKFCFVCQEYMILNLYLVICIFLGIRLLKYNKNQMANQKFV